MGWMGQSGRITGWAQKTTGGFAVALVAFYNQRGTCEQYINIKEGKNAIKWTRLSCRSFAANAVRLQLHALAYNLGNFMRTLAMPRTAEPWSLTSLREKLIKIGAKVVSHGRYVTFQMAEVAVPRQMFQEILSLIAQLRAPPVPVWPGDQADAPGDGGRGGPRCGQSNHLSARRRGQLAALTISRVTRHAICRCSRPRRDEHGLTTTRNPGNVGSKNGAEIQERVLVVNELERGEAWCLSTPSRSAESMMILPRTDPRSGCSVA
jgi:hypothetical protein